MRAVKATCEIYSIAYKNACRWKWRYAGAGGMHIECAEEYKLFMECVHAARACGYEPRASWVRGALPAENAGVRTRPNPARDIDRIIDGLRTVRPMIRSIWLVADCADGSLHRARLYTWDLIAFAEPLSLHRLRKAQRVRRRDVRLRVLGAGNRLEETSPGDAGAPGGAVASDWQECNPGEGYYVESSGAGEALKRTRRRAICLWPGTDALGGPGA